MGVGCEQAGVCCAAAHGAPERCDARQDEPTDGKPVWYRGWEITFSHDAAGWTGEGWHACLGGADLDCIQRTASTWEGILDEIDDFDEEDEL
jgi:hypothetical protein